MWLTKVISLLVLSNVVLSIQEQNRLDDINLVLQPGYPGYKQPKFSLAPRQPEGRSLYYRKTPRVEKYRSAVHELYMRPYNYVSYEMGGSNPTQYNYHYETQHPNYPEYPSYHSSQHPSSNFPYHPTQEYNPQPDYHKPEYHQPPEYPKVPEYNQPEYHQPQEYHHPSPYPEPYSPYQPTFYASPTPAPVSYSTLAPTIEYLPKTHAKEPTPEPTKLDANLEHHAVAVINSDKISGVVHFHQTGGPTSSVRLLGNITGLTPGHHGFHIHQLGDTSQGCKSMKGHFNPYQIRHGAPEDTYRHVGDLGNIYAGNDGVAIIDVQDSHLSLNGLNSIIGRGVVIHAGKDDLGKGGDEGSLKTGNAGGRVACAVIGRAGMTV